LSGYAGTGKTTIMKFLHAYLRAQGTAPVYAAPTNKAAIVTTENNRDARSMTINKLLNLPVRYDPTQHKLDLSELHMDIEDMHLPDGVGSNTVVIIDESSMIDDSLLEVINYFKPFVKGIVFMGDAA
jgi:ATP-dependent exoDNAse (exonuclease V) alpha subunit